MAATPRDFWSVLHGRRSVRFYTDAPVPADTVGALLSAALAAPSAHNRQPWRWLDLKDHAVRVRLVRAMGTRWERDMRARGLDEKVIKVELRFSYERFVGAPVLLMPCLTMAEMDRYENREARRAEHDMGIQSVAASIQNLLLAAAALGLGACWCCAPLYCQPLVRRALRLPGELEPQAFVTVGAPRHQPPAPPRKAVADVIVMS